MSREVIFRPEAEHDVRSARLVLANGSVIAAVGHSIFNRTCKTSVGDLMSKYGGGHRGAGPCVLPLDKAADAIDEILFELQANG